jgi:hypothetical protein
LQVWQRFQLGNIDEHFRFQAA